MANAVRRQQLRVGTLKAETITDLEGTVLGASNPGSHFDFFDDFFHFAGPADFNDAVVQGDLYNVQGDAATAAVGTGHGGVLSVDTVTGTDNNDGYIHTLDQIVAFSTGKKAVIEARVRLTEAATDDANIIFGVTNTVGANFLLDAAGGPAASYDGAVFFKVDGGTVWQAESSDAGAQVTDSDVGAFTSATWAKLRIAWDGAGYVRFYLDGKLKAKQAFTATAVDMYLIAGVKEGGSNNETLEIDYLRVSAER